MKTTKQIMRKALCLMISALLLTTSLPMQALADGGEKPKVEKRWERRLKRDLKRLPPDKKKELREGLYNLEMYYSSPVRNSSYPLRYTIKQRPGEPGKIMETFTMEDLRELLKDRTLFTDVDTYITEPIRVDLVQERFGTALTTDLNGKPGTIWLEELAGDYIEAPEFGVERGTWYKSKKHYGLQKTKYEMTVIEDRVAKHIPVGSYIDVDNLHIYFPSNGAKFKSVRALYVDSLSYIQKIGSKLELTISKHFPQFKGLLFKPLVQNNVEVMEKGVVKESFKKQAIRTGARRLFALAIGLSGLLTFLSAPEAEAAKIDHITVGEILNQQETTGEGTNYEEVTYEDFLNMSPSEQANFYTEYVGSNPEKYADIVGYMSYKVIPDLEKELKEYEAKEVEERAYNGVVNGLEKEVKNHY